MRKILCLLSLLCCTSFLHGQEQNNNTLQKIVRTNTLAVDYHNGYYEDSCNSKLMKIMVEGIPINYWVFTEKNIKRSSLMNEISSLITEKNGIIYYDEIDIIENNTELSKSVIYMMITNQSYCCATLIYEYDYISGKENRKAEYGYIVINITDDFHKYTTVSIPVAIWKELSDYLQPNETPKEKPTRNPEPTYPSSPSNNTNNTNIGYYLGFISPFESSGLKKFGFTLDIEDSLGIFSLSLDYLQNSNGPAKSWVETETDSSYNNSYWGTPNSYQMYYHTGSSTESSLIFGASLGYPFFDFLTVYAGGGLGFTWLDYSGDKSGSSLRDPNYSYNDSPPDDNPSVEFTWKVNAGLRIRLGDFFTKFDVSYGTILGPAFGVGIGIIF